jgi:hypothetical protein
MKSSPDPILHRQAEQRFIDHVERLLDDERLRIDTLRGRKPVTLFQRIKSRADKSIDLKRLMIEMRRTDRELQKQMPAGQDVEVVLSQKKWWFFHQTVGRMRTICVSPGRSLLTGQIAPAMTKQDVERTIAEMPTAKDRAPTTIVIMSTSGFAPDAKSLVSHSPVATLILVEPNDAGGFTIHGPPDTAGLNELLDPEAEEAKRKRIREAIDAGGMELSGSGVASDRIAAKTQLPAQMVEAELKSYAKEHPGLAAKRLDGRVVLFRESSAVAVAPPGGISMPMIDKIRSLFAGRGETEKKIAFLAERRAALGQSRDRAYEEIATLEQRDGDLKEQFKSASAELSKRRITSQLLQLRKDLERRNQLVGVLNQQINVVSTHLHNLELVQQGNTAKLPDSEEMANDAAAAEEMLATLQESSEMAASVGGVAASGLSEEEQALYDELAREVGSPAEVVNESEASESASATTPPNRVPPISTPQRDQPRKQRGEAEPG